jgi:AbiV family abortive infection protein
MQEGIDKCKENIADYLHETKLIVKEGKLYHAVISAEFALEEFGKLLLLKDIMRDDPSPNVTIDGKQFCDHDGKARRALSEFDPTNKYRILFQIWDGVWKAGIWEDTEIGNLTRLKCAFVDFLNNRWTLGTEIDPTLFQEFITKFEEAIK